MEINKILNLSFDKLKVKLICFLPAMILLVLTGCANQGGPSGGEIDKVPPKIVECFPDSSKLNFDEKYIEFTFSKYVDKRTFKEAVFISPAIDGVIDYSWSGKTVAMKFKNGLKPNRTYTVTIGTDVVDLHNRNRMDKSYHLTFSTGSKIDKGVIKGKVYADKPSGIMLYAYIASDTLDITKQKPEYVSQAGEKGDFSFSGIFPSKYRVFAVKDEFKDFLFHPETNLIGVPCADITVEDVDSTAVMFNYMMSSIDTLKPRIVSAVMTDKNHILATFSEDINLESVKTSNFVIQDSSAMKEISPLQYFKGKSRAKDLVLTTNVSLSDSNKIYFTVNGISDIAGNITKYDFVSLVTNQKADTSAPQLFKTEPANRAGDVSIDSAKIHFYFDDGFLLDSLKSFVKMRDTSKVEMAVRVDRIDDASFSVTPLGKLKSNMLYSISFPFNKVSDLAGNRIDSLYEFRFTTINDLDNTGIHGKLTNYSSEKNPVLILKNQESTNIAYISKPGKDSSFHFDKIKAGKYKLMCYYDINKNGSYDFGFPYPFRPSEPFEILEEVITAPARWSVTDVVFDLKLMK